MHFLYW